MFGKSIQIGILVMLVLICGLLIAMFCMQKPKSAESSAAEEQFATANPYDQNSLSSPAELNAPPEADEVSSYVGEDEASKQMPVETSSIEQNEPAAEFENVQPANATVEYALQIANKGFRQAILDDPGLAKGVNVIDGQVVYKAVAQALNLPYTPLEKALGRAPL